MEPNISPGYEATTLLTNVEFYFVIHLHIFAKTTFVASIPLRMSSLTDSHICVHTLLGHFSI